MNAKEREDALDFAFGATQESFGGVQNSHCQNVRGCCVEGTCIHSEASYI
jgi:hypothetical protein